MLTRLCSHLMAWPGKCPYPSSQITGRIVCGYRAEAHPQFLACRPLIGISPHSYWLLHGCQESETKSHINTEIPSLHICHILLYRNKSHALLTLRDRGSHKDMNIRSWGSLGAIFGSVYHDIIMEKVLKSVHSLWFIEYHWPPCIECIIQGDKVYPCH